MKLSRNKRGQLAEQRAQRHLRQQGLDFIDANVRGPGGEIDLIMRDGDTVVFVEVRFRGANSLVGAAESIDPAKQARILATAQHFLQRRPDLARHYMRFDVVAIETDAASGPLQWLRDVITA